MPWAERVGTTRSSGSVWAIQNQRDESETYTEIYRETHREAEKEEHQKRQIYIERQRQRHRERQRQRQRGRDRDREIRITTGCPLGRASAVWNMEAGPIPGSS